MVNQRTTHNRTHQLSKAKAKAKGGLGRSKVDLKRRERHGLCRPPVTRIGFAMGVGRYADFCDNPEADPSKGLNNSGDIYRYVSDWRLSLTRKLLVLISQGNPPSLDSLISLSVCYRRNTQLIRAKCKFRRRICHLVSQDSRKRLQELRPWKENHPKEEVLAEKLRFETFESASRCMEIGKGTRTCEQIINAAVAYLGDGAEEQILIVFAKVIADM